MVDFEEQQSKARKKLTPTKNNLLQHLNVRGTSDLKRKNTMLRSSILVVAVVALSSGVAEAFAPMTTAALKFSPALRSSAMCKRPSLSLKMMSGDEEPAVTPLSEIGQFTEADERKYIQQNSGLGYRRNSQDTLLFAMGMHLVLPPRPLSSLFFSHSP